MLRIDKIILANGGLSQPIECNRTIEHWQLNRFRSLVRYIARKKTQQNVDVMLIYTDLNKQKP